MLVRPDRPFVDKVGTSTIAYEGPWLWREYEGGVQDWLVQTARTRTARQASAQKGKPVKDTQPPKNTPPSTSKPAQASKLSFKDQRELDTLMKSIDALELEQKSLREELEDSSLYQRDADRAVALHARDTSIEEELMQALDRWTALSARSSQA